MSVLYLASWLALDAIAAQFELSSEVSLWYPPTGLTVALLLVFGIRYIPVLLLPDVLHGLLVTDPQVSWWSVLVGAVVGTVVYGGAVAVLVYRLRIDPRLPTQRDVGWFLGVACLGAPLLVAVVQVVQFDVAGLLSWTDFPVDVFGYWSGNATGVGVLAPALLIVARRIPRLWPGREPLAPAPRIRHRGQRAEVAAQAVLLVGSVYLAFGPPAGGTLDLASLVYVPLLWIAVPGSMTRTVGAVLVMNVLAVGLAGPTVKEEPLRLQLGLMTMTLAGLALGAVAAQHRTDVVAAQHTAVHDPLTGLANRVLLMDRISAAVHRHERDPGALPALLYCDLDGFKGVNDALGHDIGDELLIAVARRLEEVVRPADLVGRLGGDEIVVLLDGTVHDEVGNVAQRALAALRRPYQLGGGEVVLSASIGAAVLEPETASGAVDRSDIGEAMLRDADAALQQAKRRGGDQVRLFSPPMRRHNKERLQLPAALRRAVAGGDLSVVYQPIFELPGHRLLGLEALARWHDPDLGQVEPDVFIAAAEKTGLIHDLGAQVLDLACAQFTAWRRSAGAAGTWVAVNVSPQQLLAEGFAEQVVAILDQHGLSGEDVHLEITESSATDLGGPARGSLQALSQAGVPLAVDDFGTGWASFETLRDLAPHTLKIDRSFISRLGTDTASTVIVQAILAVADHLKMTVIAEGIETAQQRDLLVELGCPQAQGYYLGIPRPIDDIRIEPGK